MHTEGMCLGSTGFVLRDCLAEQKFNCWAIAFYGSKCNQLVSITSWPIIITETSDSNSIGLFRLFVIASIRKI